MTTDGLVWYCKKRKASSFLSIPDACQLRRRLSRILRINRHVYQSSWLHTCITVPGFTRVSEFLGSHFYQSSWVNTRVSEFLGSHVYQSSWVYTCIKVTRFTCVSEFLGSHRFRTNVLKLDHIPVKYPLKPLRPSVRLAECNNFRIVMKFSNG
jgi:hypothetical protein